MRKVKVYGADWCEDTREARRLLDNLGVDYTYVNIEQDAEAARWVKEQNDGRERKPTIKIGERVLRVPRERELETALRDEGLIDFTGQN